MNRRQKCKIYNQVFQLFNGTTDGHVEIKMFHVKHIPDTIKQN